MSAQASNATALTAVTAGGLPNLTLSPSSSLNVTLPLQRDPRQRSPPRAP